MKDIELPPLPDPKYIWHDADEPGEAELFEFEFSGAVDGRCDICERLYSGEQMSAYARAAVEADRAQRVPDWNAFEQAVQEYVEDYEMIGETEDGRDACYTPNENDKALLLDAFMGFDFSPWLLAATPAPAQQERKPMTDEQAVKCIEAAGFKTWTSAHFRLVRQAERHHGIKE